MVLAGHFERGGEAARAASYYLRAAEQAFHVLDIDATTARVGLGLGCAPPEELRIALLGLRCEASSSGKRLGDVTMVDAEELMRSAPRGSLPWTQGVLARIQGTMLAGRIKEFLASLALLREVDPDPEAVGTMGVTFLVGIGMLDVLRKPREGTALEQRFFTVVRSMGDGEPLARFWWNVAIALRASYAHEDPWSALQHSEAIQAIFDVIGGERIFLNLQVVRG